MDNRERQRETARLLEGFSDTPALDARFLVEEARDETELASFVRRRQDGEPVFKILGHRGFWSLDLKVSRDTLDPRPDSETVIETVLRLIPDRKKALRFLDLGTGSGCLLLALLSEYTNAEGVGIDASAAALKVAAENGLTFPQASFVHKDWNDPNWTNGLGLFDVIVSNPPYIPTAEIELLEREVKVYDPLEALDGGQDGLDAYRRLIQTAPTLLKKEGLLVFEIGKGQEKEVSKLAELKGLEPVTFTRDLAGIMRCLVFRFSD